MPGGTPQFDTSAPSGDRRSILDCHWHPLMADEPGNEPDGDVYVDPEPEWDE